MPSMENLTPEQAAAEVIHKARGVAQAVETAREVQMQTTIEEVAQRTKKDVLEVLKEVFGDSDTKDPEKMKVLVKRIPILCTNVEKMHTDIGDLKTIAANNQKSILDINENIRWGVRVVIGAMLTGIIAMAFFK